MRPKLERGCVVDASVVMKWFADEPLSQAAIALRDVPLLLEIPLVTADERLAAFVRAGSAEQTNLPQVISLRVFQA